MGWDGEDWGNPFPDRGNVDGALRLNVGTLARYDVACGYGDGTCNPTGEVLGAQTVSFIARAMVARGYWQPRADDPGLYPEIPASSGHRGDLATYVHYAGTLPSTAAGTGWRGWDRPATREWFAMARWQALQSYYGAR
jgi:hypothetical protein